MMDLPPKTAGLVAMRCSSSGGGGRAVLRSYGGRGGISRRIVSCFLFAWWLRCFQPRRLRGQAEKSGFAGLLLGFRPAAAGSSIAKINKQLYQAVQPPAGGAAENLAGQRPDGLGSDPGRRGRQGFRGCSRREDPVPGLAGSGGSFPPPRPAGNGLGNAGRRRWPNARSRSAGPGGSARWQWQRWRRRSGEGRIVGLVFGWRA